MDDTQNNNQFPNTSPIQEGSPTAETSSKKSAPIFIILLAVILVLVVVFAFLFTFTQKSAPTSLGVDKNGVQIINLNKKQVVEKTTDVKPLNEPEVHAVFRWAVEHPDEAARLSPEQKANIIRALNE